jgi:hypothetical protein
MMFQSERHDTGLYIGETDRQREKPIRSGSKLRLSVLASV